MIGDDVLKFINYCWYKFLIYNSLFKLGSKFLMIECMVF